MTGREALGLLLALLLLLGGRVLRDHLLIGPDGDWRDHLPGEDLLPPLPAETRETPKPTGPFDVNAVGIDTLCCLPGVGPVLAGRIVAERRRAPFRDADDMKRVKGIGPALARKLGPHLIFGDIAVSSAEAPQETASTDR